MSYPKPESEQEIKNMQEAAAVMSTGVGRAEQAVVAIVEEHIGHGPPAAYAMLLVAYDLMNAVTRLDGTGIDPDLNRTIKEAVDLIRTRGAELKKEHFADWDNINEVLKKHR